MRHINAIEWHTFESVEEAANAAYLALVMDCAEAGLDPNWEVVLYNPEESKDRGHTSGWHLIWESGPHQWGVSQSMATVTSGMIPPWGFCETQWGFDLIFVEE